VRFLIVTRGVVRYLAEHRLASMEKPDFPLPPNLPRPVDDGAAEHLKGAPIPPLILRSTSGRRVNLSDLRAPRTVIYCYPMTGVPGKLLPLGWDLIPGARGCTPQTCGFRDHHQELVELQVEVFGLSTQTSEYQQEMARRLQLPFEILTDAEFKLCDQLHFPTFEVNGMRLLKRLTMVVRGGRIEHVFYPVFPPNESAEQVLRWLRKHPIPIQPK
jgi:peroxiredoxin